MEYPRELIFDMRCGRQFQSAAIYTFWNTTGHKTGWNKAQLPQTVSAALAFPISLPYNRALLTGRVLPRIRQNNRAARPQACRGGS